MYEAAIARGGVRILVDRLWLRGASKSDAADRYPYLLRGLSIDTPNQAWAVDTTYVPMRRGFVYLTVVLDWATRVLAWRLVNSLGADVTVAALEEAIAKYDAPEIMDTTSVPCRSNSWPDSEWLRDGAASQIRMHPNPSA